MNGVLLVNLGSPDSPATGDVKKYLGQFLMDKRVIDIPWLWRTLLVKGIILNTRPKKSAAAYKKIWTDEGSPLIVLSEKLRRKVQKLTKIPVVLAMRYGNPSLEDGLKQLQQKGVTQVMVLPLYPQFAMASTETIEAEVSRLLKKFPQIRANTFSAFYNNEDYIKILAASIKGYLSDKNWDHLLFSYHGVPERHIKKSDITNSHCQINNLCCITASKAHRFCYRHQCYETTRLVTELMQLEKDKFSTSFQSRLGKDPWLRPYTDEKINQLAADGKKLAIVTPAFVSDCLETLEEIGMEGKEEFNKNGGSLYHLVPCLNDRDDWSQLLATWINEWDFSKVDS